MIKKIQFRKYANAGTIAQDQQSLPRYQFKLRQFQKLVSDDLTNNNGEKVLYYMDFTNVDSVDDSAVTYFILPIHKKLLQMKESVILYGGLNDSVRSSLESIYLALGKTCYRTLEVREDKSYYIDFKDRVDASCNNLNARVLHIISNFRMCNAATIASTLSIKPYKQGPAITDNAISYHINTLCKHHIITPIRAKKTTIYVFPNKIR